MILRPLLLSIILSFIAISLDAQNATLESHIYSFGDIPIYKAEIIAKKSGTVATTDSLGYFTIDCNKKEKLVIKAAGFKTKQIKVKKIKRAEGISIEIAGKKSEIDQAIANGHISSFYTAQAKKRLHARKAYSFGFNNMTDLIKGKFPQLTVTGDEVIMRGSSSLNGSNGVLFAFRGATYSWAQVNTIDVQTIKNIEILTGSAANRYGPGSGNGVIRIELLED